MNKYLKFILSLPKSLYFCLKHFPLSDALFFPALVSYKTKLRFRGGGKIVLDGKKSFGRFRVGFHEVPVCNSNDQTILDIQGTLICKGNFYIGNGSKIRVAKGAELVVDNNFHISASSTINCYCRIVIGHDVLFSWDCLVMDSDTHPIFDETNSIINFGREIVIGDHVWLGCNTIILKGTIIPDNCVIGAYSLVSGQNFLTNTVIAGNPAKSRKKIGTWKEIWPGFV